MESNLTLLNQARAKDLGTLAGANYLTQTPMPEEYVSTEARELAAYYEAMRRGHLDETPDAEFEEDMQILRGVM